MKTQHSIDGLTLTMERLFDAPKELVFSMFSSGENIAKWWGPTPEWTVPVSNMDFSVGGRWHYMMKGPDDGSQYANTEAWGISTFKEIDPPNKIIVEDAFTDETGEINADLPISTSMFEFIDQDGKTLLINTSSYSSIEELNKILEMGAVEGFNGSLENLERILKGETK